jgi:hypothetical protein
MNERPIFSPKVLAIGIGVAVALFALSIYVMARGDNGSAEDTIGPTTNSRSALGYAGIADVLERVGTPIVRSRSRSVERTGDNGVLVMAEPRLSAGSFRAATRLLDAPNVLIILPKWDGAESDRHPGWIGKAEIAPWGVAELALGLVDSGGSVVRGPAPARWSRNQIGIRPVVAAPMQFVRSKLMTPIVASGDRILVGEIMRKGHRIWVLSDPDVMVNYGLSEPANADFSVALVGALRNSDGPVVFDEAMHGVAGWSPTVIGLLFHFPFIVPTLLTLAAAALLLWATTIRFGAPAPTPPAIAAGKRALIDNTAGLIALAGRRGVIVRRFVDAAVQDVARELSAPRGLTEAALLQFLSRVGTQRGVDLDPASLVARADATTRGEASDETAIIALVRDANRWKQGMTHGH